MKEYLPISIVDCEVVKEEHPDEYDVSRGWVCGP